MSVISTIKTDCKDCYKCVRSCPMKAIRVSEGRAQIVEERCINDGNCIHICPQGAKQVRTTDLERVRTWLDDGEIIAVSLAPSYPVGFPLDKDCEILRILRNLGFAFVQETALAAEYVAEEHVKCLTDDQPLPLITSSCPVVVDLIEKHYPHLIPYLAPVLSPMALHGKMLKAQFPKVVFIGPCIAKKEEMEQAEVRGAIDAVLTFKELQQLVEERLGSDFRAACTDMGPDDRIANRTGGRSADVASFDGPEAGLARLFPLGGGLLRTAALSTDSLAEEFLTVTGLEEVLLVLDNFESCKGLKMLEILACKGGCINGVGVATQKGLIERRQELLKVQIEGEKNQIPPLELSVKRSYNSRSHRYDIPSEEEILQILAKIGKTSPDDELNCGSCGYNSCREKAIAVYNGFAELEMCLPYMRSRAESMSNVIIHSTPNGLIVVDKLMKIIEVNPSAERMFQVVSEQVKGMELSRIMDDTIFRQIAAEKGMVTELRKYSESLIVRQYVFYVDRHDLVIGILYDVTTEEQQKEKLDTMREETLKKAQDVIDKQMRVAQEIAGLLGETTAETKVTLTKLMNLMEKK